MTESNLNKPRDIGTFWHGPELGDLERACLLSMTEKGHDVTLFSHDKVKKVPDGILWRDAREISGDRFDIFTRHAGYGRKLAVFADIFRYLMIRQTDMMWADADIFLLEALQPTNEYLFAWEYKTLINNAVFLLPKSSPALRDLNELCDNQFPIPPFYKPKRKARLWIKKIIGFPNHISRLSACVAGPEAVTYYLRKSGEDLHALAPDSFYPIHHRDLRLFFLPNDQVREQFLQGSQAVHLWGSFLRTKIQEIEEIPAGSFLSDVLKYA